MFLYVKFMTVHVYLAADSYSNISSFNSCCIDGICTFLLNLNYFMAIFNPSFAYGTIFICSSWNNHFSWLKKKNTKIYKKEKNTKINKSIKAILKMSMFYV